MQLKKTVATILCIATIAGSLAACGQAGEPSGAGGPAGESASPAAGSSDSPGEQAGEAGESLVNKEGFPIVNQPITLTVFGEKGPIHAEWEDMDMFQAYQEMTGINLEFKLAASQGYEEQKNLMFTSGDYPDIIVRGQLTGADIVKYGTTGVLLPLEDLLEEYAPNYAEHMNNYSGVRERVTAPDGHIYTLSSIIAMSAARTEKFWLNTQWLEQVEMETPGSFDELEQVLRAFKDLDANGDGVMDEIAFGSYDMNTLVANFAGCWGLQRQFERNLSVDDGVVSTWITSDEYRDMLQWFNQMYNEGILDPEVFTQEYSKFNAKMSGQKMGFFINMADDAFDSTDYIGIAPFTGKSDTLYVKCQPVAREMGAFAITTKCEYPEAALRWQDYFYSLEGSYLMRYGVEGKTWNRDENGLPVYADGILDSPDGAGPAIARFTIWPGGGAPQLLNDINSIATVSLTTAAAQEALEPFIPDPNYGEPLFSPEINERLLILYENDIKKYMEECAAKFARGDMSFDQWDTYVDTLGKMGLDEWVQIYQDLYDSLV